MIFLDSIFDRLKKSPHTTLLQESAGGEFVSATGADLAALIQTARAFLRAQGLKKGDRCALLRVEQRPDDLEQQLAAAAPAVGDAGRVAADRTALLDPAG